MSFAYASHTDARNSNFSNVGRDQVNILHGQDSLDKLKPVVMDASRRDECLPNTRTDLLKFIVGWVNDPSSQQNILWLHGLAGSGKSTLSTTTANVFRDAGQLGAFLFFDRDVTERNNPTMVIRTLAHQLAASDLRLAEAIRAVVDKNSNILMSPLHLQFQKLILDPLSTIADTNPVIVFVMDALDECGTADEREKLLAILADDFIHLPFVIRTVITSRAENDIYSAFASQHHVLAHELDIASPANSDDILSYFQYHMSLIRHRKRHLPLNMDWPGEELLRKLVERASGLFVWASTACEFINGHDPRRRLDIILNGEAGSGAEAALDGLYKTALEAIDLWEDEDFIADFRDVLGVILVARQPPSSSTIDELLHLPDDRPSMHTISLLGCILQQSPTVRVLHPSFADFLTMERRCGRDIWFFNSSTHHRCLAFRCMDRMDAILKRNMCNMTISVDPENESLSEDISYSCSFWIDHICVIKEDLAPVVGRLRLFLFQHLLHWFEAMSILKRPRDTIHLLDRLMSWLSNHVPHEARLSELIGDACRFARNFADSIEEHPLLVYMSALPFTPTSTTLYQVFHRADSYPSISGGFHRRWSPLLQILSGHMDWVRSVAVSPDGKRLASGSDDRTVRVWDAATGAEILELRGHHDFVLSVAFSPDGTSIVSGGADATVRVWNLTAGDEAMPTLRVHDGVTAVAFSPDGSKIVYGLDNNTFKVWDTVTGVEISEREHEGSVESVIFSPDGARVIWGSVDRCVRVWDWTTASDISELRGHDGGVQAVNCSPDSQQLVSGSDDTTILVWDATEGAVISKLVGHERGVTSVAFSPDGTRIVSGSYDNTIRIWDAISGLEVLSPLRGHDYSVMSAVFSPDGTTVISGSADCTIRIWDVPAGAGNFLTLPGHEHPVRSVAFSSDGTKLLSGSDDETLRVWDATSGAEVFEIRGHEDGISSINFSPDGRLVVSGSYDKTIRVWNTITGDEVFPPLRGHNSYVTSVTFSPDGGMIASGSADATIRVWDALSGAGVSEMRGHDKHIFSMVFSPDARRIASASLDQTIRVWDATTGAQIFPALRGHPTSVVASLSFSPDGSRIISQSDYESLSWDATTGCRLHSTSSDYRLSGSMFIMHDVWIVDSATERTLGRLPTMVDITEYMAYRRSLAVGTTSGRVILLHFPHILLTSPDTRTVEGKTRQRF